MILDTTTATEYFRSSYKCETISRPEPVERGRLGGNGACVNQADGQEKNGKSDSGRSLLPLTICGQTAVSNLRHTQK